MSQITVTKLCFSHREANKVFKYLLSPLTFGLDGLAFSSKGENPPDTNVKTSISSDLTVFPHNESNDDDAQFSSKVQAF